MSDYGIPPERPLPARRVQRRKEHLVNELTREGRQVYRRRLVLAAAAAVALLTATGFGTYALTRDEPTRVESIGCYSRAAQDADVSVIGNTAQDPVQACADLWREGAVGPTTVVPSLQACVLETGAVAVLPGSGAAVCHRLGIAPLPEAERREFRRLGALQAALVAKLDGCKPAGEARGVARRALDAHGFRDWSVEIRDGFSADRPCAAPLLERHDRRVVIFSAPR